VSPTAGSLVDRRRWASGLVDQLATVSDPESGQRTQLAFLKYIVNAVPLEVRGPALISTVLPFTSS